MQFNLFGNTAIQKTKPLGIPYMGNKRKYADALITRMMELQPNARCFVDVFGGGGRNVIRSYAEGFNCAL